MAGTGSATARSSGEVRYGNTRFKAASALPGLLHHGEIGHLAVGRSTRKRWSPGQLRHIHVGVEPGILQTHGVGLGILAGGQLDRRTLP